MFFKLLNKFLQEVNSNSSKFVKKEYLLRLISCVLRTCQTLLTLYATLEIGIHNSSFSKITSTNDESKNPTRKIENYTGKD